MEDNVSKVETVTDNKKEFFNTGLILNLIFFIEPRCSVFTVRIRKITEVENITNINKEKY